VPGQLEAEQVLFQNLFCTPAVRAVELGNQRLGFVDTDLVDTVLVAVQCEGAAVAAEALALDGIHDEIRGQSMERVAGSHGLTIPPNRA